MGRKTERRFRAMKKSDAIAYYGSVKALAAALHIWPQAVYKWGEYVPARAARELETITKGGLKAETLL